MEPDPLTRQHVPLSLTHTQPISLPSNGAGPLRMTTRPLRISGHYPQGNASGPWGQLAAHSLRLSPHICQKQVRTAPCVSSLSLWLYISPLSGFSSVSHCRTFSKHLVKAAQAGQKVRFPPEGIFTFSSYFKGISSRTGGLLFTHELIGLCIGQ